MCYRINICQKPRSRRVGYPRKRWHCPAPARALIVSINYFDELSVDDVPLFADEDPISVVEVPLSVPEDSLSVPDVPLSFPEDSLSVVEDPLSVVEDPPPVDEPLSVVEDPGLS